MISDQQIGKNIRNFRELKNYTQTAMAEFLEISQKQMSRIETGEVSVPIQLLFKICDILEVDPSFLLEFDAQRILKNSSVNQSAKTFGINESAPLEEVKALYERLLKEKDERIRQLLALIKPSI